VVGGDNNFKNKKIAVEFWMFSYLKIYSILQIVGEVSKKCVKGTVA
jgi:hypothetical protein